VKVTSIRGEDVTPRVLATMLCEHLRTGGTHSGAVPTIQPLHDSMELPVFPGEWRGRA
jgi:hypothetical protein